MTSAKYGAIDKTLDSDIEDNGYESLTSSYNGARRGRDDSIYGAILKVLLLVSCVGLSVFAVLWQNQTLPMQAQQTDSFSTSTTQRAITVLSVSNEYGILDSTAMFPYSFLKGSFLIEPYKKTTITFAANPTGCSYEWSFTRRYNPVIKMSGTSSDGVISVTLTTVGEYIFAVNEKCQVGTVSSEQLTTNVWVKYVRRELSTLTDIDRENFLDAFHTLWTTSTTKGQLLYGDRYKSVNYFATLHNDGGGNAVCDEFHGGVGFVNNHMYLSAYLEQSLQLVNPRVALHYMEYSKYFTSTAFQNRVSHQLDGGAWTEILTSKYLGTSDPITGRIIDGRWENASVPHMTDEFMLEEGIDKTTTFFPTENEEWLRLTDAHLSSPYGLLRSPWNYNPTPMVARFGNVYGIEDASQIANIYQVFTFHMGVNCTDYTAFFKYINHQPVQTFLHAAEDDTHGKFHFTFGGVGGPQADASVQILLNVYNLTYSNIASLTVSAQHYYKKYLALSHTYPVTCTDNPWQNGVLQSNALPGYEGGPKCDFDTSFYLTEESLDGLIAKFFNYDADSTDYVTDRITNMPFDDKKAVMKIIANMFPYDGDLAGSGAALDPLFWVAHGAVERSFQKAVFADAFTDLTYDHVGHCSGHSFSATKAWLKGFYFTDETIVAEDLTNADLVNILIPTTDEYRDLVNFVYDTASFDWCDNADTWFQ